MPTRFDLPTLSDKDYAKLKTELTAAIPQYSDTWTDYNESDPGITLLELLSWLADATLYRIDAVPTELYLNFVRLLVGATGEALDELVYTLSNDVVLGPDNAPVFLGDGKDGGSAEVVLDPDRLALAQYLQQIEGGMPADSDELRRRATAFWRAPYRAVTADDFAALARQTTIAVADSTPEYQIARVVTLTEPPYVTVIPISAGDPGWTATPSPGDDLTLASLTVNLNVGTMAYLATCYLQLVQAVSAFLKPRLLIGTPVRVRAPLFSPVELSVRLAVASDADPAVVLAAAGQAALALLSPLTGGRDGTGWPYGRRVTDFDILGVILPIPGVDRSQPVHVAVREVDTLEVGRALVGTSTFIGSPGAFGLPQVTVATLTAMAHTWTLQVGVHSTVGVDTVLPYLEA